VRLGNRLAYRLCGGGFNDLLNDLLGHLLNDRFGFKDRGALAELALANGVNAIGCGGLSRLVFGQRRGRPRNAQIRAILGAMGCLGLATAGFGAAAGQSLAGEHRTAIPV
jgi:hypothetical protein